MNPWEPYLNLAIAGTLTIAAWGLILRTIWLVVAEILGRRRSRMPKEE